MRSPMPTQLRNSFFEEYKSCPRKAQFAYGFNWRRDATTSPYLIAGAEFAAGMEARRYALSEGMSDRDACVLGMQAIQATKRDPMLKAPATHTRGEVLMAFISASLQLHEEREAVTAAFGLEVVPVEFGFIIPAVFAGEVFYHPESDTPLQLTGRLDSIEYTMGKLWGVDDKFVSKPNTKEWFWRSQFSCYTWAFREYGVRLHGFRIKEHSAEGLMSTTYIHDVTDIHEQLDEWELWVRSIMREMTAHSSAGDLWPQRRNEGAFGCCKCTYKGICSSNWMNQQPKDQDIQTPQGFIKIIPSTS